MEPAADAPNPLAVWIYVALALGFVFVWLAELGFFLYRYTQATKDGGGKAATPVLVLWIASMAFVFAGPCMVVLAFGSFIGGLVHLKRRGGENEPTRIAALATVVSSASMLLFALLAVVILGLGGYLG